MHLYEAFSDAVNEWRLQDYPSRQAGLLTPFIEDWRSMVDSVMIETAYDGEVLNVTYLDVPERKNDLVVGDVLHPPKNKATVAITAMLGEEVLEARKV